MIHILEGQAIKFDYVNWQGEKGKRRAVFMSIAYGVTEHHKNDQWLLEGYDLDKADKRTYAINEMSNIEYIVL